MYLHFDIPVLNTNLSLGACNRSYQNCRTMFSSSSIASKQVWSQRSGYLEHLDDGRIAIHRTSNDVECA